MALWDFHLYVVEKEREGTGRPVVAAVLQGRRSQLPACTIRHISLELVRLAPPDKFSEDVLPRSSALNYGQTSSRLTFRICSALAVRAASLAASSCSLLARSSMREAISSLRPGSAPGCGSEYVELPALGVEENEASSSP